MFNATISGKIKRVIHDNGKADDKAMVKVVVECRKQFAKKDDMPFTYPVVTIWGYDAQYFRDYAGAGHYASFIGCDLEAYRPDGEDKDQLSFRSGKVDLLPKEFSDQITVEDDEDDKKKKKGKGKGKGDRDPKKDKGKSRSQRRAKDEDDEDEDDDDDDDDDEDEDEAPRKKKKPAGKSKEKEKSKPSKDKGKSSKKKSRDEDDDDDDDDYYDDDDDYFDDEDED